MMKVLGLIPARGGSKGVPGKNIRLLNGKPLLEYSAASALESKRLSRVILSTEDESIAAIGKKCGLDVPFLRPPELAADETPTLPVVQHVLKWLESENDTYDGVCLLQPTNPLRRAVDIDNCIDLFESRHADSVISVLPIPTEYNPHWAYRQNDGQLALFTGESAPISRRQDLPRAFFRDGTVYVTRSDTIMNEHSLYGATVVGYEIDPEFSVNIDTEEDWEEASKRICS